MSAAQAVVISGAGRYSDPWHPFEETSAALGELLTAQGLTSRIHRTDAGELSLAGVDLVVVNAGGGSTTADDLAQPTPVQLRAEVLDFVRGGGPALVVHTGSNTFYETPEWAGLIGGRWVPGISMHPPLDTATVSVRDPEHPITADLPEPVVRDERYSYLEVDPSAQVLLTQRHAEIDHPILWTHTPDGVRVVYDALGHDAQAYEGAFRRELLRREVDWLLG